MAHDPKSDEWVPLAKLISQWGIKRQSFHEHVRPLLPDSGVRGAGKRGVEIHFPTLLEAYVADKVSRAQRSAGPDSEDPLLTAGGDSPNLERYRLAKAQLAERDLAERDKTLVRREVVIDALRPAATGMRAAGDRLIRQFGNDAGLIYNEAVDDFESAVKQAITRLGTDDANSANGGDHAGRRTRRADASPATTDPE